MAKKVYMFVLNNFTLDQRVAREAKTLVQAGYDVTVYALLDDHTKPREVIDGVTVIRTPPVTQLQLPLRIVFYSIGLCRDARRRAAQFYGWLTGSATNQSTTSTGRGRAGPPRGGGVKTPGGWIGRLYDRLRIGTLDRLSRWRSSQYYKTLFRQIREAPPDVLHAHDLNTLPVACLGKKRLGGKIVYDSHELFTGSAYMTDRVTDYWTAHEKKLIVQADAVITVCDSIARELHERYGVRMPITLRNCPEKMTQAPSRNFVKDLLGLPRDIPLVLYQGKLSRGRGLENTLEATKLLDRAAVVFMGWGPIEDELKQMVRLEGLDDRLFIIPPVPPEDLLAWTASADIGIAPIQPIYLSYYYALPNKLFEYISAGVAVAASRLPEMTRLIEQYDVGVTFDPDDPQDMARAINGLLADPDWLARMKRNAVIAARDELNWETESENLLRVYQEILAPARG